MFKYAPNSDLLVIIMKIYEIYVNYNLVNNQIIGGN